MPFVLTNQAPYIGSTTMLLAPDGNYYRIAKSGTGITGHLYRLGPSDAAWTQVTTGTALNNPYSGLALIGSTFYAWSSNSTEFYSWTIGGGAWVPLNFAALSGIPNSLFVAGGSVYLFGSKLVSSVSHQQLKQWTGSGFNLIADALSATWPAQTALTAFPLGSDIFLFQSSDGTFWKVTGGSYTRVTTPIWNNGTSVTIQDLACPFRWFTIRSGILYFRNLAPADTVQLGSFFSWDGIAAAPTALVPYAGQGGYRTGVALWNGSIYTASSLGNDLLKYNEAGGFTTVFSGAAAIPMGDLSDNLAADPTRLYVSMDYHVTPTQEQYLSVPAAAGSLIMPAFVGSI